MKYLDIELNLWPNAVNKKNSRMYILYFRVFCLFIKTSRTIEPIWFFSLGKPYGFKLVYLKI